ncbi:glutathione S-transferase family protein [Oleomonas cavernae]|uniref:Glutathione S-transferase family protein n=1 Tax=Oleomonas cavernae TaxID=2320859 RepID=A0A418WEK0_9PROT|nr:glutathione S-transferase family protein [Oleomonas cavernae]RJF88448.1 glutathione S-transferase family protein [Oleomonas cavernae]
MVETPIPVLVIGDKNLSSWSMRPWVALHAAGIAFDEVRIKLRTETSKAEILRHSPAGKVPALKLGAVAIGESIAICEWAAENAKTPILPQDPVARAVCRAAGAEMHAGFGALRNECPMDMLARFANHPISDQCLGDITRIDALWNDCRRQWGQGGPYLFGAWSLADAMFAPVVSRFITYDLRVSPAARAYLEVASHHPSYMAWAEGARAEAAI